MTDERARVAAYWGNHDFTDHLARIHWMGSPVVRDYLNQLASGDPELDWIRWAWGRYVAGRAGRRREPQLSVLVLGCGTGWLDRHLARLPEVATVDACDVSEGAVQQARETARREGLGERIRYHVVDLNHEPPPGGPHDVAVAHSVLHHVEDLERAYPALVRALEPGGLLIFNEYVGPRRFQFTAEQMAVINAALARLPERYRRSAMMPGAVFPHKEVPTVEQMIAVDPSESVRSDELLAFTRRHFRVLEERAYGGTVLQHLLYDVVQNFDSASLPDARLLGLLCLLEEALLREGVLPSDYALVVARREGRSGAAAAGRPHPGDEEEGAGRGGGGRPGDGTGRAGEGGRPGGGGAGRSAGAAGGEGSAGAAVAGARSGLRLEPAQQPVPPAVPVRRTVARERGETPPPAPRRSIHSRPRRDLRLGWDLPPVRDHLHRLATGNPRTPWATWVLDELLPHLAGTARGEGGAGTAARRPGGDGGEGEARPRPGSPAGSSGRALLLDPRLDWLERAVAAAPGVAAVDVLVPVGEELVGEEPEGEARGEEGGAVPPAAGPPSPAPLFRLHRDGGAAGPAVPLAALELPAGAYSLVFTNGWLGRAPERAALARTLVAALAPGGLLVGDEWLGPPDGRTTPRTLGYARQVVELLQPPGAPEPAPLQRLRQRLVDLEHRLLGPSRPRRRSPAAPALRPAPPSPRRQREGGGGEPPGRAGLLSPRDLEPPRGPLAEELARLLGAECPPLVVRPTGGALLQRVLPAFEPAAEPAAGTAPGLPGEGDGRQAALAFVALAAYLEELLTGIGVVDPEYACFVARRRG